MDKAVEAALKVFFEDDYDRDVDPYEQMTKAITAADEARAVSDEEIYAMLPQDAPLTLSGLRAAGLKVVRR